MNQSREQLPFDVLFVGGGPACLAGALRLAQLAAEKGLELEIGLIEKGGYIGAHSLSGAVVDPRPLAALIPDYRDRGCPVENCEVLDALYLLTPAKARRIPVIPPSMDNHGCFVASMSRLNAWLGEQAEALGVNVFCGFSGVEILYGPDGKTVAGVRTGDRGVDKNGGKKPNYEPGADLLAKVTVLGEGPCGSLARDLDRRLGLFPGNAPQIYETAVKEVVELPQAPCFPRNATVLHTFGHPLDKSKGGGFLYAMGGNRVSLGLVMGLDYENPAFAPYDAFLAWKSHPLIRGLLAGGKVLQQGAKTLCVGGYYSMPRLAADGVMLVGESASMLNPRRLKGVHASMESGMLAAQAIIQAFEKDDFSRNCLSTYEDLVRCGLLGRELFEARNFSQALSKKGAARYIHLAAQHLTEGAGFRDPLPARKDNRTLKPLPPPGPAAPAAPTDGALFVDKLTGVHLSGTRHEENQPCHIIVRDPALCAGRCFEEYGNPCTRFCPGQVYEMEEAPDGGRRLKLNPSNCLHCKTCEIKDPLDNIAWTCPEGGGGPRYQVM